MVPLFAESRVGKDRVKRLEENARSSIYSLPAGTAALAVDSLYSLLFMADPTDTALRQQ